MKKISKIFAAMLFLAITSVAQMVIRRPMYPPAGGGSPVAFDATANGACDGACGFDGTGSTLTYAHTTGSGNNRGLLVGISIVGNSADTEPAITSVTYGGAAMTLVSGCHIADAGNHYYVEFYALAAPASGANNVIVALAGVGVGQFSMRSVSVSATNVNQSTPANSCGSSAKSANTGSSTSLTITNGSSDLGLVFTCQGTSITSITGTSQWDLDDGQNACASAGAATQTGGTTAISISYGGSDSYLAMGTSLKGN